MSVQVEYPDRKAEPAFREHASGLLVPADVSRKREVWTSDEWRLLNRLTRLMESRGMQLLMRCTHPDCKKAPIESIRQADGSNVLRCEHADRVFQKAF